LLADGNVLCHPYIVGEISCGTPPKRRLYIDFLANLESLPIATHSEVLATIETHQLFGHGCGYVDMCLIASALISEKALIWTLDKSLKNIAASLGRAYVPKLNS
jgi:predicted nucleic acid-binding protein